MGNKAAYTAEYLNDGHLSIPKEIVEFMKVQERIMDDMVRVAFNDAKKLSLFFGPELNKKDEEIEQ